MLQDIFPHKYDITFGHHIPKDDDYIILTHGDDFLLCENPFCLPTFSQLNSEMNSNNNSPVFLFSIDTHSVFWLEVDSLTIKNGLCSCTRGIFRQTDIDNLTAFLGSCALHLINWYKRNVYCGRCAAPLHPHKQERSLVCEKCGEMVYPKISPAVILAITNGDKILLTRYIHQPKTSYALVAGFIEVGESPEDAAAREAMEEVGLRIKNLRYYKSQPWPFTDSMLIGYFADVDGDDSITLDETELALGEWIHRDDIPPGTSTMSLTRTMIDAFRDGDFPRSNGY